MARQDFEYKSLKEDFYRLMSGYPNARKLIETLEENGELMLFGGAVREYMDTKFDNMPRDFDLVLDNGKSRFNLSELLYDFDYKKNRFGGYKINIDSLDFDIWEIEDTWAFKEKKIECRKTNYVKELEKTVFLNIDSIVYSLNREKLYGDNYKKAMEEKVLDIVLEENPFKELNFLRAIIFKIKYDMVLSEELTKSILIYKNNTKDYLDKLYDIQIAHYNYEKLSRLELQYQLNKILDKKYY